MTEIPKASVAACAALCDAPVPIDRDGTTVGEIARRAQAQCLRSRAVAPWLERILETKRRAVLQSGARGEDVERHLWSWLYRRLGELEATVYLGPLFEDGAESSSSPGSSPFLRTRLDRFEPGSRAPAFDRWAWEDLIRVPPVAVALYCLERSTQPRLQAEWAGTPLARIPTSMWFEWMALARPKGRGAKREDAVALEVAAMFLVRESPVDPEGFRWVARLMALPDARRLGPKDLARCRQMLARMPVGWGFDGDEDSVLDVIAAFGAASGVLAAEADRVRTLFQTMLAVVASVEPSLVSGEEDGDGPRAMPPGWTGSAEWVRHLQDLVKYLPAFVPGETEPLGRLRRAAIRTLQENGAVFTPSHGLATVSDIERGSKKRLCKT